MPAARRQRHEHRQLNKQLLFSRACSGAPGARRGLRTQVLVAVDRAGSERRRSIHDILRNKRIAFCPYLCYLTLYIAEMHRREKRMSQTRPFRFGLVAEGRPSREQWAALARQAEDQGYATFLMADHYVNEFPPIAALMAVADTTSTLRVGSFVFDNDFRHPALLAKEIATLDLLSGGRVEFGIGAGWHRPEYEQIGLEFSSAGTRISRLEEALQIIRQFFTEETVTFSGSHYTVTDLKAFPKPLQRPHPPFFMGGGGKKFLSLAGREADIVGLHVRVNDDGTVGASERTDEALTQKIEWVRQAAGERFPAIELNILIGGVIVTDDRQQAAEERARAVGRPVEQILASPYLLIGSVEQIVEQIQRQREQFGISYLVVGDESMEAFAPVVARLAGKE